MPPGGPPDGALDWSRDRWSELVKPESSNHAKSPMSEQVQFPLLLRRILWRPSLSNDIAINSLFANVVLVVEGESEEVYLPWLYRGWRAWVRREVGPDEGDALPAILDRHAIQVWSIAGNFQAAIAMFLAAFFKIPYAVLIDEDEHTGESTPQEVHDGILVAHAQGANDTVPGLRHCAKCVRHFAEILEAPTSWKTSRKVAGDCRQACAALGYHVFVDRQRSDGRNAVTGRGPWQIEDSVHEMLADRKRQEDWKQFITEGNDSKRDESLERMPFAEVAMRANHINKLVMASNLTRRVDLAQLENQLEKPSESSEWWATAHLWLFFRLTARYWQGQFDSANPRLDPRGAYRHGVHAGNWGDIAKQIALAAYVEALPDTGGSWIVVDTHAGEPQHSGIDWSPAMRRWRDALTCLVGEAMRDWWSAGLLVWTLLAARPVAVERVYWIDHHPAVVWAARRWLQTAEQRLRQSGHGDQVERVYKLLPLEADGWAVLAGIAPRHSADRRPLLALIDPPYSDPGARLLTRLAMVTLAHTPSAWGAAWYPLSDAADGWELPPNPALRCVEWVWQPREAGSLAGCGMWLIVPDDALWHRIACRIRQWSADIWPGGEVTLRMDGAVP